MSSDAKPDVVPSTTSTNTNGGRSHKFKKGANSINNIKQVKFEGRCSDMKGNVYDCNDAKQTDQYSKTTKELADYVGRTYKYGGDMRQAILSLTVPVIQEPQEPDDEENRLQMRLWEKQVDEYVKKSTWLAEHIKSLYSLVWGQCSEAMRQKIESLEDFETISMASDGVALLTAIKNATYNYQSQKYRIESINEALRRLIGFRQGPNMATQDYYEQFLNRIDVYVHTGGSVAPHPGTITSEAASNGWFPNNMTEAELGQAKEMEWANIFITGADRVRYGSLITSLQNEFLNGNDRYPKTLIDAYNRLTYWREPKSSVRYVNANDGVTFAHNDTDNEEVTLVTSNRSKTGKNKDHITCHKCGQKGHYANQCTAETGEQLLISGVEAGEFDSDNTSFMFQTSHGGNIPETWILLDNQSTVDVFKTKSLLKNITNTDRTMTISCNAGKVVTNQVGELSGYGTVWYQPTGIANILSLARVREKGFKVLYNDQENQFQITKLDGTTHIFQQSPRGLYFLDTQDLHHGNTLLNVSEETTATNLEGVALINIVDDNKAKFSQRDYLNAVEARKIMHMIGRPSLQQFLHILDRNQLPNCPVTRRDALNAEAIFGTDVGSLKGKTVHRSSVPVQPILNDLPAETMAAYKDVVLCADIMYVNKIPFFVTISRHIHFSTVEMLHNRKSETVLNAIKQVNAVYQKRGFNITHMLIDGEFDCLRGALSALKITRNTATNDEHVPEIERFIRTLKERTRCVYNTLPFKSMPPRLLIEMVYASNFWLNCFPYPNGISDVLSPRAIVTGMSIDFIKHCKLEFGSYVQVHEAHDNSMVPRTSGAIALRPTGNAQGGYVFYSLTTGRCLNRNRWTALPMPSDVIDRVHKLSRRELDTNEPLLFGDRNQIIEAEDPDSDDESYHPNENIDNNDDESTIDHAQVEPDHIEVDNLIDAPIAEADDDPREEQAEGHNEDLGYQNNDHDPVPAPIPDMEQIGLDIAIPGVAPPPNLDMDINNPLPLDDGIAGVDDDGPARQHQLDQEMGDLYGARNSDYGLRPRRPRDYSHLHATLEHTVMTQYSMKRGIKLFGSDGVDAVLQELKQLHDRNVIEPVQMASLSADDKRNALQYLMFLKQKRTGKIKGRGCADGRKQRSFISKEDSSSPTVSIEAVMLTCTIDAQEKRDVATVDIPGAFMQAEMDDIVYMKIEGTMAELLVKLDTQRYQSFVTMEGNKKVLYLQLKKALYGTLKAALLFWKRLSNVLLSWGFEINPYDRCVANKEIDGTQCTIIWHVDDLKISHAKPTVIDEVINMLSKEFGNEAPLTINRGKIHDYLGMTLDYSNEGKVIIIMSDYIKGILDELPEDMNGVSATPAANHLFEVNCNPSPLDTKLADFFHHVVAQLLFLCKRARPDIQTAVSFLCTRVKNPDIDDYKKLTRVMRYLRGTLNMNLTLEGNDARIMKWWVDASYAVHHDLKSHTGGILTLGKGAIYATSTRQKLNTKSSTEAELVGVSDVMTQVLWTRYFLDAQGYGAKELIIYQDNKSAILLENNGRTSSSKRTRHINIRYYFVTDRIDKGEVTVEYCPTKVMIADFFTKALQGAAFTAFRDYILNIDPGQQAEQDPRSVLNKVEPVSTKEK
jgi:hypothetical protein